jgi:hypothetical protein
VSGSLTVSGIDHYGTGSSSSPSETAGSSYSQKFFVVIIACGGLCCLGCPCSVLALLSRRRRFRALRAERAARRQHEGSAGCTPPGDMDAAQRQYGVHAAQRQGFDIRRWRVQSQELPCVPSEAEAPSCRPTTTVQLLVADEGDDAPVCAIC